MTSAPQTTASGQTLGDLVSTLTSLLAGAGIADPSAEARDLLAAVAGEQRFWPRVNADNGASAELIQRSREAAERRASGMPFAYAVGRAAFRHLTLVVNQSVLIPRQETEILVDLVLARKRLGAVADVGTGSGAIALALASEGDFTRVIGTDLAQDALSIARTNAARTELRAPVEFRAGDLLAPLAGETLDVLVSNPPYIAYDEARTLPSSVRDWEPSHALFTSGHGLDATRRIVAGAPALLCRGGLLALEVDERRALEVAEIVATNGSFDGIEVMQDLAGRDRFVLATRTA